MVSRLHEFLLRLRALFRRRRMEREMAEELEFHQAMLRDKLLREGVSPKEANTMTRRTFGDARRWRERLTELWQFPALENFLRDVSFSARLLKKSPGFTAVALLTLAIGIGANTAIFSLIDGLLLRPLPVLRADRLVVLRKDQDRAQPAYSFGAPLFRGFERRHEIFADVFAFSGRDNFQVREGSTNVAVRGMLVSGEFFHALETPPLLGRYLTPVDDQTGGNTEGLAAIISESFWQRLFHRDPTVLGRKLVIANVPFTVVGVMPKRFIGADPTQCAEIYVPLSAEPIIDAPENWIAGGVHSRWLTVLGRLNPGVTLEQANAALLPASMPIVRAEVSDGHWIEDAEKHHLHFAAEPGARGFTYIRMFFRKPLVAVFAMCGGILLLACVNLASLLLARAAARKQELATRLALGATRARLIQQLLMESLLITSMGTVVGLAVAPLVSRSLASILMSGFWNGYLDISLDMRVLLFVAGTAAASTLLIGLIPAMQATAGNLNDSIKCGQHARQTQVRQRILPRALMVAEVALTMVLVIGAGLLATSLVRLFRSGLGFDSKGLVNITFDMAKQPLEGDALTRLYQTLGEELRHLPGVKNVSWERVVPLSSEQWDNLYSASGGSGQDTFQNRVGPGYFQTMRIPMLEGREFRWGDTKASGMKVILNRSAAKQLFGGKDAVGQRVHNVERKTSYEVVGVVGDTKYQGLGTPAPAMAYLSITQTETTQFDEKKPSYTAVVRIDGPLAPLAAAARSLAGRLVPTIPTPVLATMNRVIDGSISSERMMAMLSVFFAACALFITGIGLYGTLAYATARRTSEIGIRMALGAQRVQVVSLIFRENAWVAAGGLLAGLVAALLASRALASFLYGTSPRDPWVMIISALTLGTVASTASLIPAIRAALIEPITAIRHE